MNAVGFFSSQSWFQPTKKNSSAGIEYKTTIAALQRTQGVNPVWNTDGAEPVRRPLDWSELGAGDNFEEEDPCAICHEELSSAPITTLDCRHQFHDEVKCFCVVQ